MQVRTLPHHVRRCEIHRTFAVCCIIQQKPRTTSIDAFQVVVAHINQRSWSLKLREQPALHPAPVSASCSARWHISSARLLMSGCKHFETFRNMPRKRVPRQGAVFGSSMSSCGGRNLKTICSSGSLGFSAPLRVCQINTNKKPNERGAFELTSAAMATICSLAPER